MSDQLDEQERRCHEMLEMLQDHYHKAAEPWLRQLAQIHATRHPSFRISLEEAERLGLTPLDGAQKTFMEQQSEPAKWPGKGY